MKQCLEWKIANMIVAIGRIERQSGYGGRTGSGRNRRLGVLFVCGRLDRPLSHRAAGGTIVLMVWSTVGRERLAQRLGKLQCGRESIVRALGERLREHGAELLGVGTGELGQLRDRHTAGTDDTASP
jgi:hypothetical protein